MALTQFDISQVPNSLTNILINGGMEFWQRNTTFSSPADGAYTLDRWKVNRNGAPTFTISRESGAANVDSGGFSMKMDITAVGGGTNLFMSNRVENGEAYYKNKTVSFSIRVKASAANLVKIQITDGVGSTSSSLNTGTAYETLTVTHTVSSSASELSVYVGYFGTTAISTTYVDSAMLVSGFASATFMPTDQTIELSQCQRYYEKSGIVGNGAFGFLDGSSQFESIWQMYYKVTKRVAATTVVTYQLIREEGSNTDNQAAYTKQIENTNTEGFTIRVFKANAGQRPNWVQLTSWTADSEI